MIAMSSKDEKPSLLLRWNATDQSYNPIAERTSGIYLELDDKNHHWLFEYSEDVTLIARRTALRRANEIAKVGVVHPVLKKRVGVGYACVESKDPYHNLPDKVTRSEHEYNKKK